MSSGDLPMQIVDETLVEEADETNDTEQDKFCCESCGKIFKKSTALKVHKKNVHSELNLSCLDCGKKFANNIYLQSHINRKHRVKQSHKCGECDKRLVSSGYQRKNLDSDNQGQLLYRGIIHFNSYNI